MEIMGQPFVFQIDSPIVNAVYESNDNFLIEYDKTQDKSYCAIYFCSNYIYYPNTGSCFITQIIEKNKYEWYETRVPYAYKHIFIRDIHKQWYLTGINSTINSPELLFSFLQVETKGYQVITLGSSAGGFASVLYGSLLNAQLILSFNGQFEINSLLNTSSELVDPVIFRFYKSMKYLDYFEVTHFITDPSKIFYFYSNYSQIDIQQKEYIEDLNLNMIGFKTNHHGVPFLKCNLPVILAKTHQEFVILSGKVHHVLLFSLRLVGIKETIGGLYCQILKRYFKK